MIDSRPRRLAISSVRRRHLRGFRAGLGQGKGEDWPPALSFLSEPLPCSSHLLAGPSRTGSLTGRLDEQSSDQIRKVQEPQNWSLYLLPSHSIWGTKATYPGEHFLGLGEALVCNLNVASFMEESLLLRKALG